MKVVIDNKQIETKENKTILEVAQENGIDIPSLCNHPRLVPFSGCRLCIVEVEGRKGYSPSCSTFVEEGIVVKTDTNRIRKLRQQILELILTEHPNACLICTEKDNCDEYKSTIRKVGEVTGCVLCTNNKRCELQDVVDALKIDKVHFPSLYRNLDIKKEDPFFDRNYNLCILCGRCVRICHEVRGASAVSFVNRGSETVIGTILNRPLIDSGCQFCGACVDVCPTGALTERSIRYETLADEKTRTICPFCSMGCEVELGLKEGRILYSMPVKEGQSNKGQACVKGRFVIREVVHSPKRLLQPMIRKEKELEETSWDDALDYVAERLNSYNSRNIAVVMSPQATCEESYVFQKFAREGLKARNIFNVSSQSPLAVYQNLVKEPGLNFDIERISEAKTIFLFGTDITASHPMIWLEVLKAVMNGARLILASSEDLPFSRLAFIWLKVKPGTEHYLLAFLSKQILENGKIEGLSKIDGFNSFKKSLSELDISQVDGMTGIEKSVLDEISDALLTEKPVVCLFGWEFAQSLSGEKNLAALRNLAIQIRASLIPLGLENNQRGAYEIRRYFEKEPRKDSDAAFKALRERKMKAHYLAGPFPYMEKTKAEFVIVQDSFMNKNISKADVVLPAATFAETEGTFVNVEGRMQKLEEVIAPLGESKPDWWIISQLAQRMGLLGFDYKKPSEILKEVCKTIPAFKKNSLSGLKNRKEVFIQDGKRGKNKFIPVKSSLHTIETSKKYPFLLQVEYNLDYYKNLTFSQEIKGIEKIRNSRCLRMSPNDADNLKLQDGDPVVIESEFGRFKGIAKISEAVPEGTVLARLLWNEDPQFSVANIASPFFLKTHAWSFIPVKTKRGK